MSGVPAELAEIERYLHEHIPLSQAMGVMVRTADTGAVCLAAPLAPNINHRHTVFGGSAASVAILAAWTLLHLRLRALDLPARIVIQRGATEYLAPITGDFSALCLSPPEEEWERFVALLRRRGKARLTLFASLFLGEASVATFEGDFVALSGERD